MMKEAVAAVVVAVTTGKVQGDGGALIGLLHLLVEFGQQLRLVSIPGDRGQETERTSVQLFHL